MKKIRAKLLSTGDVLVSVTTTDRTPKGYEYSMTDHFEVTPAVAEILLYDLHGIVETLRGVKRKPSRPRRLAELLRRQS